MDPAHNVANTSISRQNIHSLGRIDSFRIQSDGLVIVSEVEVIKHREPYRAMKTNCTLEPPLHPLWAIDIIQGVTIEPKTTKLKADVIHEH